MLRAEFRRTGQHFVARTKSVVATIGRASVFPARVRLCGVRSVSAVLVRAVPGANSWVGREIAPVALHRCQRFRRDGASVVALADDLTPLRRQRLDLPDDARLLAATSDMGRVVAATDNELFLCAESIVRVGFEAADTCSLLSEGPCLVTAPVIEHGFCEGRPRDYGGKHRVALIDADSGQQLAETLLDTAAAGVSALPHPSDGSVLLDAGEGQDGSHLFSATITSGGDLAVTKVLENQIAASFNPAGDRLLLTPHPSFDGRVRVVSWPDLSEIASLTTADVDWSDDAFDLYGCFLDTDLIILSTRYDGPYITNADLGSPRPLDLSSYAPTEGTETGLMFGTGPRRFVLQIWRDERPAVTVWDIARI